MPKATIFFMHSFNLPNILSTTIPDYIKVEFVPKGPGCKLWPRKFAQWAEVESPKGLINEPEDKGNPRSDADLIPEFE